MDRRRFLRTLGLASAATVVAPTVLQTLAVSPAPTPALAFHPDAFALTMAPVRLDVLYGYGTFRPDAIVRVWEA